MRHDRRGAYQGRRQDHAGEQIRRGVLAAISSGALAPGARLPSWIALATQLGVARGTVKSAYKRLAGEQVIGSSRVA
ncbi:GntR family transcriptional regulator [Rhodanobacter thiooxydans]|uniref:GntR family transcriptional regulator n=1 Tax=Rhodanobacter thiooxydans TaxID=416169 RepID=UPI000ADF54EA|nr:GntR family transcriptional regulator [Rhodanobacter thiooxydans]